MILGLLAEFVIFGWQTIFLMPISFIFTAAVSAFICYIFQSFRTSIFLIILSVPFIFLPGEETEASEFLVFLFWPIAYGLLVPGVVLIVYLSGRPSD